jgi:hypothetical protein
MYTHIDIGKYISGDDNINLIELYLINNKSNNTVNVTISDKIDKLVDNIYKKSRTEKYKSYIHKERVYTYELSNDNQYVYTKIKKQLDIIDNVLVISSKHDKQPNYTFPCTNDIDNICEYTIKEYKISNRLSVIIRYDYEGGETIKTLYVEYKHSQNVDTDKINEQINKIFIKLVSC